jgi:drug/metabolite transporter (DMT)-like permease
VQPPTNVTTSLLLSALLFGERISAMRIVGVLVMFAGMLFASWNDPVTAGSSVWIGDLMFAAAAMMWAVFGVLQRKWGRRPLETTAVICVFSMLAWTPVYFIFFSPARLLAAQPSMLLLQVLVLGLGSGVIAVVAFTKAVHELGPGSAGLFTVLVPGIANLVGIPLVHELPTVQQWSGLALSACGLVVALRFAGTRKPRPA